ncbi:RIMS-binding protein 2 isoform X1 [Tachysurus ichikawai]
MNPQLVVNEVHVKKKETHGEEKEESRAQVTAEQDSSSTHPEEQAQKECIEILESELSKKRKECEGLEHEVRKRQKRCLDLESQLEDERGKNECLTEEAELLRRKAQLLEQVSGPAGVCLSCHCASYLSTFCITGVH